MRRAKWIQFVVAKGSASCCCAAFILNLLFSLQCLQQHPQQCGPHAAGLSLPPHRVAQKHSSPSGYGVERYLYPGRNHGCMRLRGKRKAKENLKTRVTHSGFPFAFLAGELNPPVLPSTEKSLDGTLLYYDSHPSTLPLAVCPCCCLNSAWACEGREMSAGMTPMTVVFPPVLAEKEMGQGKCPKML